ncbi:MAG TPA: UDP-2,4-diacetamido-2,4,6-trideoxy-beta-L-altropyranose hydrolase [Afipia sp.]
MKIAFRVDANNEIGGGHLVRCLVLARSLAAGGADICFLTNNSLSAIDPVHSGFSVIRAEKPASPIAPMLTTAFPDTGADVLVIDHYEINEAEERAARAQTHFILSFDDMPTRRHDCDLLVDQNFGTDPAEYTALISPGSRVLAGSQFALLREEFGRSRAEALQHRVSGQSRGVFVCFGMSDQMGMTFDVLQALFSIGYNSPINIVIGSSSTKLDDIRAVADGDRRIALAIDPTEIAPIMSRSAVAIGGGGSMHWERCCLGLPAVCVVLAENQRRVSERLVRGGAIELASISEGDDLHTLACKVAALEGDDVRRNEMSRRAAATCDGMGAARIVDAISALTKLAPTRA